MPPLGTRLLRGRSRIGPIENLKHIQKTLRTLPCRSATFCQGSQEESPYSSQTKRTPFGNVNGKGKDQRTPLSVVAGNGHSESVNSYWRILMSKLIRSMWGTRVPRSGS